jgi:transcription initiation factor TFIID subunit 3
MTPPPPLFHALLRPAILQILRATGYHSAKTSVIDSVTDLAARYLLNLCQLTALFATHNSDVPPPITEDNAGINPAIPAPTVVDIRMALQRSGALLPERIREEQEYLGEEDTRGVENFIAWAMGPLNREIKRIALDGDDEAGDYLDGEFPPVQVPNIKSKERRVLMNSTALKKKHSKNEDDSKFLGTVLGKCIEHGDVLVEGGECPSIFAWEERRRLAAQKTPEPPKGLQNHQSEEVNGDHDGDGDGEDSRPPSSGLSSLGDRSIADEMDMS